MEGKVMFALLLLVALCAVVAIIISAVTLSRPSSVPTITLNGLGGGQSPPVAVGGSGRSGGSGGGGGQSVSGRVYTIAIGHDWGAHQYLDEKNFIQGFTKDLILEEIANKNSKFRNRFLNYLFNDTKPLYIVCQHGHIDCRIVWDSYPNCWRSVPGDHSMGGVGIYGRWYDACADWEKTVGRSQVFDFGLPYLKPSEVFFFIRKGASFDPKNIKNKTIGFMNGWVGDEKCIARQSNIEGNLPPQYKFKYFDLTKDAAPALHNGTVDALFLSKNALVEYMEKHGMLFSRINSTVFHCGLSGCSIMTRKDTNLIPLWNKGFQKMKESGRFQQICAEAENKHGHKGVLLPCEL